MMQGLGSIVEIVTQLFATLGNHIKELLSLWFGSQLLSVVPDHFIGSLTSLLLITLTYFIHTGIQKAAKYFIAIAWALFSISIVTHLVI